VVEQEAQAILAALELQIKVMQAVMEERLLKEQAVVEVLEQLELPEIHQEMVAMEFPLL
jgi:hypothetical protein